MREEKLVSVCIPVLNGEKFLAEMLESILSQTYRNIEIIVSDNCSIDNSCKIVEMYMKIDKRIRLYRNDSNIGYSGNANKLINLANGEFIALYHADDIYESTIIEEEMNLLSENEKIAGVFTSGRMIDDKGNTLVTSKKYLKLFKITRTIIIDLDTFIRNICETANMLWCPTSLIKKSVYNELNFYNKNLKYIEDQDMWIRILEKYDLGIIPKELFKYRVHSSQGSGYYSSKKRQELDPSLVYMKEYLDINPALKTKYSQNLSKRVSRGYLTLAKNAAFSNDYDNFEHFMKESKHTYKFRNITKYSLIQLLDLKTLFIILRIFYKMINYEHNSAHLV